MKIGSLLENANIKKAGIIPFVRVDDEIEMLFMISSDPNYGGPDPMVSKGRIDAGETPEQAAIREGHEELGLRQSNFAGQVFHVHDAEVKGLDAVYVMRIFAVEVKNKDDFDQPHYETKEVVWLSEKDYEMVGRRSHRPFVKALCDRFYQ